jgi:hypothetical protein
MTYKVRISGGDGAILRVFLTDRRGIVYLKKI